MTFKTTLLSTAAVIALAVPGIAQTADTEAETATECAGELVDGVCVNADGAMTAEPEMEADADAEAPMEEAADAETDPAAAVDADIAADAEEGIADETDTMPADTMAADTDMPADRDLSDDSAFTGMTVSEVVGMPVEGAEGGGVGEIDYIVATAEGHDAVIGIGGFLGLGEYTVALPLGSFTLDAERQVLVLDGFTEEELEAMPEIDESELDDLPGEYVLG